MTEPVVRVRSRSWWRQPLVWIGFSLSALAIATFIMVFDMALVGRTLLRVRWPHVLISAAVFMTAFMARSLRWQLLLSPLARLPFGKVRDVLIVGYMANLLLPARLGEVARALALWKVTGTSRRGSLTTIGLARLFDGFFLLGLLAVMGLLFELPSWTRKLTLVLMLFMAGVLLVALMLAFREALFLRLLERLLFFVPRRARSGGASLECGAERARCDRARERVVGFFARFAAGSHALRSLSLVLQCALATMTIWALEFVVYFTMMRGFGITLPPWAALLALVVTNIGIAAPSAPGHVGLFEAACSGAVIALGVEKELALSYAIGVHLMMYVCLVVTGQFLMWRLGLQMSDLTARPPTPDGPA